ncbi:MAG: helix-turn-helix domain-containing protein [Candidatus Omnitrophica bacterium]|nr:helix-turn-helix domain-containing protein [Candidatus Omnitrophota bacterium]MBU4478181.1 helix-turn-helix domain-containing protein [Candidatus Omnitrophota bacterium]MCG2703823.1 helix-turn-helix domain-containing protein [Candidatus Omnitrophota bacterium]
MAYIKKQLGCKIRAIRKQQHLTISELAEKTNLSDNFIGCIERGTRSPTIETLDKISKALEIKIHNLFYFSAEKPAKTQILDEIIYRLTNKDSGYIKMILKIIEHTSDYFFKK